MAAWGTIVSKLARLAFQDSNRRLIETLKVNGEVFDNIQDEFLRIVLEGGIRVHSFQEARGISGVKGLSGKVVDDYSSKLGLVGQFETVESIDANHMQMVRCSHKNDPQYRAILGVLRQFVRQKLGDVAPERWKIYPKQDSTEGVPIRHQPDCRKETPHQTCYYIRLEKNPRFTGRDTILDEIEDRFFIRSECRTLALAGLGGVGKTQVALQFAYRIKYQYPDCSIFWVAALSHGTFEQAYTEIAHKLGVQRTSDEEDIKEALCRYLSLDTAGKWLLVVDNADDLALVFGSAGRSGIIQYFPCSDNGLILMTTRSQEVAVDFAQADVIEVGKMSLEEATGFLEKSLIQKEALQDAGVVDDLLNSLAYLPLAIAQAAAYLNQTKTTIARYLKLVKGAESEVTKLFSKEFRDKTRYDGSHNAVARTWLMSFEQIQQSNRVAVNLLTFLSCIEPKAIPQSILPNPESFETESAVGILCGYSFLARRRDSETFDMHSLVHIAARAWTQEHGRTESVMEEAICHLAEIFSSSDWSNRHRWRQYLPHAFYVLDRSRGYNLEGRFNLVDDVGRCLDADRRFKEAIRCYEEVYVWRREQFSEDDNSRLASEYSLARAYLNDRRIKEAIKMFEHIVEIQREMLDETDHNRLASEHELARAYLDDRRIKKAVKVFEHVVEIQRETLDETDHNRLASEHELARAYLDDRRIKEAIEVFEHVVEVQKETLDKTDHDRLTSEHELARAYLNDKQIKEAIKMFEHIVEMQRETLDETDHSRLASESALATAYLDNRRIKEAIKMFEHIVEMQRETLDETDNNRLASEHELARAYLDDRRIKEAIKVFEHVVEMRRETLDETDYSRLASEHTLAYAYLEDGQAQKAVDFLEHVVAVESQLFDEYDPDRQVSVNLLADAQERLEAEDGSWESASDDPEEDMPTV
ncbi:hypothetical protein BKA67DRAFT_312556 [Truncatella angustata]|uniref:NB-ARC domain-containing protein n=1 Tax=Truncatella angustata TaxID=152316 RepID=A0A9P8UJH8_9PEZI|nr:uncharacterized protein BKA67DRAFT_312556 [Truncatella angustata]KAH6653249.1 hypothetical protein BKA67DRAFT_312556 [Truncatella angustata]